MSTDGKLSRYRLQTVTINGIAHLAQGENCHSIFGCRKIFLSKIFGPEMKNMKMKYPIL